MRKKLTAILLIMMLLCSLVSQTAFADVITTPPDISCSAYIVVDSASGEILFGKNYDAQLAPASITKIMTAVLAIESGKLDSEVSVPALPEFESGAVTIHLVEGERYLLRDLVQVMLVSSANDAAYTVANAVGGNQDKFVTQMNKKANVLGMEGTTFQNAHGLDQEGHVVTAADMAKLAVYAMQNETFREMVKVQQVNWEGISYEKPLPTTNQLFGIMPEATGIKTGNSSNAGRTLVGSAAKDGRELVGVILGAADESIFSNMKKILNYGFEHTRISPIVQKDTLETTLQFGDKEVRVIRGEDYSLILPTDNPSIISYQTVLDNVELPIKQNEVVGRLQVLSDGNLIHEVDLVAADSASKPINWIFVIAVLLSVIYIASIVSRIMTRSKKKKRRKANANEAAARQAESARTAAANRSKYEDILNSVDHPAQAQKKTLQSSRDRNRRQ